MCGRAAQTHRTVLAAAGMLGRGSSRNGSSHQDSTDRSSSDKEHGNLHDGKDNYNMAPGMEAQVFCWQENSVVTREKVWGLVPRGGTPQAPLDTSNMSIHFSNLMFNARSDTLFEKRTFSPLLHQHRTCLIALDGFFEWKAPKVRAERKQPYFVYRKDKKKTFLLMAGLWTSVATGSGDKDTLDSFTIVTTDACPSLTWLHLRMPLMIWDDTLALEWLRNPTPQLLKQLEKAAWETPIDMLQWHAVTTQMVKMSFRSEDAIRPLPPPATVKSFFSSTASKQAATKIENTSTKTDSPVSKKRPSLSSSTVSPKKMKKTVATTPETKNKGSIKAFFSPKSTS